MRRAELRSIVADVFECEPDELLPSTELRELEYCDSVSMLSLIVALDDDAGIQLSPNQVAELSRYGDIEKIAEAQGVELTD